MNTNTDNKTVDVSNEYEMIKYFNKHTRVLEWVRGNTYRIICNGKRLKSSSLDELYEMFKAAYNNLPIPERTSYLLNSIKEAK